MSVTARFRQFLAIDWSGAKGPVQKGIALALADGAGGPPVLVERGRGWSRSDVLALLREDLFREDGRPFSGTERLRAQAISQGCYATLEAAARSAR